ncbi:hypothetical protein pipiens_006746 [Culex pipiens pipiens]|uniref:Uncharacterized protein n=1 Tax=Culex pipiens pipiens TaxID=38569 RepID=A0ABD1DPY5_CULPP
MRTLCTCQQSQSLEEVPSFRARQKLAGCPADSNLACPTEGSARNETKAGQQQYHPSPRIRNNVGPSVPIKNVAVRRPRVNVGSARRRLGAGSPKRGEERVDADRCATCPRRSTASRR